MTPRGRGTAVRIVATAQAMGLLEDLELHELDTAALRAVLDRLAAAGIGREAQAELAAPKGSVDYDALLARLDEALAMSPVPQSEWLALGALFEIEDLAGLLSVAPASVRRYRAGERPTPDAIAARLHFLAGVVGDLAGAYNAYGIRRWFQRPRAQLDGLNPAQVLVGDWEPFAPGPQRVRALASALTDAGAT